MAMIVPEPAEKDAKYISAIIKAFSPLQQHHKPYSRSVITKKAILDYICTLYYVNFSACRSRRI